MPFVLTKQIKTISWPVKVSIPANGGSVETHEFTGHLKLLPQAEVDKLITSRTPDFEAISKILVDWEGVQDDDGEEVKFTKARLKSACELPNFRAAVVRAYVNAISGIPEKN